MLNVALAKIPPRRDKQTTCVLIVTPLTNHKPTLESFIYIHTLNSTFTATMDICKEQWTKKIKSGQGSNRSSKIDDSENWSLVVFPVHIQANRSFKVSDSRRVGAGCVPHMYIAVNTVGQLGQSMVRAPSIYGLRFIGTRWRDTVDMSCTIRLLR
jgi:hypothetical protein